MVDSTLTRWEAERQTRAIDALTARTRSEVALVATQTSLLDGHVARQRAAYRVQELPEIFENDRAQRRVQRANDLRETQHQYEVSEVRRLSELAQAEAALTDSRQALDAQRRYGDTTYKAGWKKKTVELLDVELNAAERRAILKQHLDEIDRPEKRSRNDQDTDEDAIDDALHDKRAELNASGLDTSRVDAAIERRRARREED